MPNLRLTLWNALVMGNEMEYDNTNDEHFVAIARLYHLVQKKYHGYDLDHNGVRITTAVHDALFSFQAHVEFMVKLDKCLYDFEEIVIPTTEPQRVVTTAFLFRALDENWEPTERDMLQTRAETLLPYTLPFGWKDIIPLVVKGRISQFMVDKYKPIPREHFDYFMTLFEKMGIDEILLNIDTSVTVNCALYPVYDHMKMCGVRLKDVRNDIWDYNSRDYNIYATWYRYYVIRKFKPRYNLVAWRLAARTAMKLGR